MRIESIMAPVNDLKTKAVIANIRKIRESKNYTQDYLAAKLGISQNAYSKIELGYSSITLSRLIRISEVLEIELTELFTPYNDGTSPLKIVDNN